MWCDSIVFSCVGCFAQTKFPLESEKRLYLGLRAICVWQGKGTGGRSPVGPYLFTSQVVRTISHAEKHVCKSEFECLCYSFSSSGGLDLNATFSPCLLCLFAVKAVRAPVARLP